MNKAAEKKSGIFSEVFTAMCFSVHKIKSFITEMCLIFKDLCKTAVETTTGFIENSLLAGIFMGVVVAHLVVFEPIVFGVGLLIICFLCVASIFEKTMRIIWRHINSRVHLKKWTKPPTESYIRFSKRRVAGLIKVPANINSEFEKEYPGYKYLEEYPCEIRYSEVVEGFYLYCRMYKRE